MTNSPHRRRHPGISPYEALEVDLSLVVFRGLLPNMVVALVTVPGLTTILAVHTHDRFFIVQALITYAICILRLTVVLCFGRIDQSKLTTTLARQWQAAYGAATFLYCCVMSVTTFYTFRAHPFPGAWLCTIGIFGVCIAIGSRNGMRPWVIQICGGMLLLTLAVSIALTGEQLAWVALIMVAAFSYQFCYALQHQFRMAVEQLRIRRELRILSEQDVLTGLANRRHFEACLATLCASGTSFAILFIDLDRFKQVNDSYGHSTGDALLMQVGRRLAGVLRSSDLLARLGGDEFAILQSPLPDAASAQALALRINQEISQPFEIQAHQLWIGASIGIRISDANERDANVILGMADQALYAVKQSGGGSFSFAGT